MAGRQIWPNFSLENGIVAENQAKIIKNMGRNDIIFSIEVQPMDSGRHAIALILCLQLFETPKLMFVKKK